MTNAAIATGRHAIEEQSAPTEMAQELDVWRAFGTSWHVVGTSGRWVEGGPVPVRPQPTFASYPRKEESGLHLARSVFFSFELPTLVMSSGIGEITTAFADAVSEFRHLIGAYMSGLRVRATSVSQLVEELREWTGLSASGLAEMLGVSRRSLYHWLREGQASVNNTQRLVRLADTLRPIAREWSPPRIRVWLETGDPSPRELFEREDFASFARAANDSLSRGEIPVLPSRRVSHGSSLGDRREPVRPLTALQRRRAFAAFSEERVSPDYTALQTRRWRPREVADSDEEDA
jgi:hypothetical protein